MISERLNIQVLKAIHRIEQLYMQCNGNIYLSYSGGKDSTVILTLIKMIEDTLVIPKNGIPAVFCDTGVELQATKDFIDWVSKNYYGNVQIIKPEKTFAWILDNKGKPIKSKMKSDLLGRYQKTHNKDTLSFEYMLGVGRNGKRYSKTKIANKDLHILHDDFDIKVSARCCYYLKKKPFAKYNKENNIEGYILGERMAEGGARAFSAEKRLSNGGNVCTKTKGNYVVKLPIIDWSDDDIKEFTEYYNMPLSKAYTEYGMTRTGCMGCPYSQELQEGLEKLLKFEPLRYKASMFYFKDVYIAQGVELPFDEEYEKERIAKWEKDYLHMRIEMLKQYQPNTDITKYEKLKLKKGEKK